MWPWPLRLTVARLRNGVIRLASVSNTISRVWMVGSCPPGQGAHVGRLRRTSIVWAGSGRRV
jgi:hypothetical protein